MSAHRFKVVSCCAFVIRVVALGTPYLQARLAKILQQDAGLIIRGWVFGRLGFFGKTPPKHAAEPRDCPCRPRLRLRVRVRSGVGLVWADVKG